MKMKEYLHGSSVKINEKRNSVRHMKLYWVTTEDHHEDWFIVASSNEEASLFHEENEGYNPGDATSKEIVDIPDDVATALGWPPDEVLLSVGATFINEDEPRIVEINGQQYVEGMLEAHIRELQDDVFESQGEERLNQTKRTASIKH